MYLIISFSVITRYIKNGIFYQIIYISLSVYDENPY